MCLSPSRIHGGDLGFLSVGGAFDLYRERVLRGLGVCGIRFYADKNDVTQSFSVRNAFRGFSDSSIILDDE